MAIMSLGTLPWSAIAFSLVESLGFVEGTTASGCVQGYIEYKLITG
jgi:hypothetical protein